MRQTAGEQLLIIMRRKNITITKLAEMLGQSRQNLSNKFKRDNFSEKELIKISALLNVEYLVEFKEK